MVHSQTIIQQELEKLAKIIWGNLILKIKYFLSELEIFTKLYQHCSVFGYENEEKYTTYTSRNDFTRDVDLLFIENGDKLHYVLIKYFNIFTYN